MTAHFTEGRASSHTHANKPQSFLKSLTLKAGNPSTAVEACDIEALVKYCSALQALHISGAHAGIRRGGFGRPNFLPVLQQLPHLTSLAVSGVSDVSVWSLAQVRSMYAALMCLHLDMVLLPTPHIGNLLWI